MPPHSHPQSLLLMSDIVAGELDLHGDNMCKQETSGLHIMPARLLPVHPLLLTHVLAALTPCSPPAPRRF